MRTFTVTDYPSGASSTIIAETMELRDDMLVFLKAGDPVAVFARWTSVVEDGIATVAPAAPAAPPPAEPDAVKELRESLRNRGATV